MVWASTGGSRPLSPADRLSVGSWDKGYDTIRYAAGRAENRCRCLCRGRPVRFDPPEKGSNDGFSLLARPDEISFLTF